MNIPLRRDVIATVVVFPLLAITTQFANAQTLAQMEYERQQREYRRQLEQQQQEQQRLQQQMNENARRQQEQSRQLNAPASQNPAPAYQGASPQTAARRQATQVDVAAALAAADWEAGGSSLKGEHDFYFARSTISRSGDFVKMWEMIDHKSAVVIDGKPFCQSKISRNTTANDRGEGCWRRLRIRGMSARAPWWARSSFRPPPPGKLSPPVTMLSTS